MTIERSVGSEINPVLEVNRLDFEAIEQMYLESEKPKTWFAVYLGDTALSDLFYRLTPDQQEKVYQGIASIMAIGHRNGIESTMIEGEK